jgi:hypothetical protein
VKLQIKGDSMALLNTVTLPNGIHLPTAYVKVHSVSGSKELLQITIQGYMDQTTYADGKQAVYSQYFSFTPSVASDAENFLAQAYTYLKTLPEFAAAIDV